MPVHREHVQIFTNTNKFLFWYEYYYANKALGPSDIFRKSQEVLALNFI
jgi:hypothetical protein